MKSAFLLNFGYLADTTTGKLLLWLLYVDVAAFVFGVTFIVGMRARNILFKRSETARSERVEKNMQEWLIDGEAEKREALKVDIRKLPFNKQAMIYLQFSRIVSGEIRGNLIRLFIESGTDRLAEKAARSYFWWKRMKAGRLLGLFPKEQAEKMLIDSLEDPDRFVRINALQMAYEYPTPAVTKKVVELLEDERNVRMYSLTDTVSRMGFAVSEELKTMFTKDVPEACQVTAIEIVERLRDPSFVPVLLKLMRTGSDNIAGAAARALADFPDEDVVAELKESLSCEGSKKKSMAAYALGKIGAVSCIVDLQAAFPDKSWEVRFYCALGLKIMGPEGRRALADCCGHSDKYVADMSVYVLSLPDRASVTAI